MAIVNIPAPAGSQYAAQIMMRPWESIGEVGEMLGEAISGRKFAAESQQDLENLASYQQQMQRAQALQSQVNQLSNLPVAERQELLSQIQMPRMPQMVSRPYRDMQARQMLGQIFAQPQAPEAPPSKIVGGDLYEWRPETGWKSTVKAPQKPRQLTRADIGYYKTRGFSPSQAKTLRDEYLGVKEKKPTTKKELAQELSRWQTIQRKTYATDMYGNMIGDILDQETFDLSEKKIAEFRKQIATFGKGPVNGGKRIRVISSRGVTGTIPENELNDYLKKGFRVIK